VRVSSTGEVSIHARIHSASTRASQRAAYEFRACIDLIVLHSFLLFPSQWFGVARHDRRGPGRPRLSSGQLRAATSRRRCLRVRPAAAATMPLHALNRDTVEMMRDRAADETEATPPRSPIHTTDRPFAELMPPPLHATHATNCRAHAITNARILIIIVCILLGIIQTHARQ
jgi:hypothetical protein